MKNLLKILLIFMIGVCYNCSKSQNSIRVDLAEKSIKANSVSGFLHFKNLQSNDKFIKDLKPGYWRIGDCIFHNNKIDKNSTQYLADNNVTPIIVLSDLFRRVSQKNPNWNTSLRSVNGIKPIIEEVNNSFVGDVIYDLWNEPNHKSFWKGTPDDFFQVFKYEYNIVRSLPNGDKVKIMGPSTAGFDKNFIDQFLNFCSQNNMRIDILAWHENGDINNASVMQDRISYARNNWFTKYSNVGIKEIYIPEIISQKYQFNPLAALGYFDKLEKSDAKGGCKSCWGDNCRDNSMDGILTNDSKPRSIYWAYKWYAESLSNRLKSITSDNNIFSIANLGKDKKSLNVLLGNNTSSTDMDVVINNTNSLASFSQSNAYTIKLYKVPNSEDQELTSPVLVKTYNVKSRKNQLKLKLDNIDKTGVFLLNISN